MVNFHHDLDLELPRSNIWFTSQPKMVWLRRNGKQNINWMLDLKCGHQFWPWPWPWPWIFKVKYLIFYFLARSLVRLPRNKKKNTLIEHKACNVAINFDLDHDLDLEFSRSNIQFVRFLHDMVLLPRNEIQTYRLNTRPQMWPSTLTLAMTLAMIFQGQIFNLLYLCKNTRPYVWPSILTFAMTLNFSRSFL